MTRSPAPARIALTALTYALTFAVFFPILWTVLTSFKSEAQAVAQPPAIFFLPTLEHYREVLFDQRYLDFFRNSAAIAGGSTLLAFVLGIPAAFSLAIMPSARARGILSWVLSTKMMPVVGVIVPLLVIFKRVGLFDTLLGMTLLYAAMNMPLVIWMMRSFIADIPRELMEAGAIDGAGLLTTLLRIVAPLTLPGMGSTALLCLIFSWNEFFIAVNLTGPHSATLPVSIAGFMTSEGLFWARMSAASTLAVAPVFIAGWMAQRSLVRGLTMGAVK